MAIANNKPPVNTIILPRILPSGDGIVIQPAYVHVDDRQRALIRLSWRGCDLVERGKEVPLLPQIPDLDCVLPEEDFFSMATPQGLRFVQNWAISEFSDQGCVMFVDNWAGPRKPGSYKVINQVVEVTRLNETGKSVKGRLIQVQLGHQISDLLIPIT